MQTTWDPPHVATVEITENRSTVQYINISLAKLTHMSSPMSCMSVVSVEVLLLVNIEFRADNALGKQLRRMSTCDKHVLG